MIGFDLRERERDSWQTRVMSERVGKEEITLGKRASTEKLFNSFNTDYKRYIFFRIIFIKKTWKQIKKNSIDLRVEFI